MEAKQKAKELVYWFYNLLEPFIKNKDLLLSKAKKSALICVKERLNEIDEYFEATKGQVEVLALWNYNVGKQRYWQEVKNEIEKL